MSQVLTYHNIYKFQTNFSDNAVIIPHPKRSVKLQSSKTTFRRLTFRFIWFDVVRSKLVVRLLFAIGLASTNSFRTARICFFRVGYALLRICLNNLGCHFFSLKSKLANAAVKIEFFFSPTASRVLLIYPTAKGLKRNTNFRTG